MTDKTVEIYTDGGCRGNPGSGAWAVLLRQGPAEKILWGFEPSTTNNRMELTAALMGLEALKRPLAVRVISDSRYLQDGMMKWLPAWQRRGWRTASGGAVKNQDLWERLAAAAKAHQVQWEWVRGHNGHEENEQVDRILNAVMDRYAGATAAQQGEGWS